MPATRMAALPMHSRRVLLVTLAALIIAALIGAAVLVDPPSRNADRQSSASVSPEAAAPSVAGAPQASIADLTRNADAATDAGASARAGTGTGAGAQFGLRIVQNADIDLSVRRRHFGDAWNDAMSLASSVGGYVVSASTQGRASHRVGSVTIRVPSARFDQAVKQLETSANVRVVARSITSDDVTQQYVDTASRLRHHRAVQARLVALLNRTHDIGDVLAVQNRIDSVQEQLDVEQGRLRWLDARSSMSTITISLREAGAATSRPASGPSWGVHAAFSAAGHRFVDNVNAAIVWIGGALPALLVVLFIAMMVRLRLRRRTT